MNFDKNTPAIKFVSTEEKADSGVLLVFGDKKPDKVFAAIDKRLKGILAHQMAVAPKFKGESGQVLSVTLPEGAPWHRLILIGMGDQKKADEPALEQAGAVLSGALRQAGGKTALLLNGDECPLLPLLRGVLLGAYSFDIYKTKGKDSAKSKQDATLSKLSVVSADAKKLQKEFARHEELVWSVYLARDLVNAPANDLYPESFATLIKKTLTPLGVKVEIMDEKAIEKAGMGCLMAVGKAARRQPRLVVMTWDGAAKKTTKGKSSKPLALVGKGITFDSGGLNVKPYEGMMDMKMDMGGAASVVGAMRAIAARKSAAHVVGIVALAENAISGDATRPGDIVTSLSGKTVEILNTDAEGRLVLADALTHVQRKYDPAAIIDLATLTGAIMIALGTGYCGTFVNDDKLWTHLEKASGLTGEKLWRMPLHDSFRREMDSTFADLKNIGGGRMGGACTAAAFLGDFIDKDRVWAHLDIAGVAMSKTTPLCPVPFGSGFGVALLDRLIAEFYE